MSERIRAHYLIETAHDPRRAAEEMAGEQSAGTFVKVPGETPELLAAYGARVESLTVIETAEAPALPGSKPPKQGGGSLQQVQVTLSFPFETIGASLTTLFTAVAGNLFELGAFSGLKLLDVEIPPAIASAYPLPAFGAEGTRRLSGVQGRPLFGTIIKPSVGLSPDATADLVATLCAAGLDFIKDDELQTNSPHSPLEARVRAVMRVINSHADKTGKQVMYAFNITGDLDDMRRGHDVVLAHGGTCIMVNLISVGLVGVTELRRHAQLPVHGHRAGWGMFSRHPLLGMEYPAFAKFMRLAGADHLHVNGLRNKFCESDASVIDAARSVQTPIPEVGAAVMPVFSSGQSARQIPDTYRAMGNPDWLYLAGGGIMAHPGGAAAGVRALLQAWEAAQADIALGDYAQSHPELAGALERFGS
jgi:ribulose-bisphosphate carboxylase large chain